MEVNMVETIEHIIANITDLLRTIGPVAGFFAIILESILPILPLGAFIAINIIVFGSILGFIISWIATIMGCLVSFYAFRLGLSKKLYGNVKIDSKMHKLMNYISKMPSARLTLLVAMPFTPAFLINITAGLSKMPVKKYLISILIGKLSIVYFWGYIGTSFIESIRNPVVFIRIAILLAMAYFMSKLIETFLNPKGVK
jgi:uncharacterized membrane protein YdjX (TVP38/TMEM64 family)